MLLIDDLYEARSFPSFDLEPSLYLRMVSLIVLSDRSVLLSNLRIRLSACLLIVYKPNKKKSRLDINLKLLNFQSVVTRAVSLNFDAQFNNKLKLRFG